MSSISVGGSDQSLYGFYQQISGNTSSPVAAAAPTADVSATSATTNAAPADPQTAQAAEHHHHAHGGLFKKIESAVTSALQSAQSDPSADPNQVVQDAIAKVFKDSGATPPAGTDASAGVKPPDPDTQNTTAQPDANDSSRQAFFQSLKSFGIDPSQFHNDLLAAVKGAQNGDSDNSSLFKNFPPGSSIDTTA